MLPLALTVLRVIQSFLCGRQGCLLLCGDMFYWGPLADIVYAQISHKPFLRVFPIAIFRKPALLCASKHSK